MTHILLFAGTADGRALAERLKDLPLRATICVATEYGGETLDDLSERFTILVGRLDVPAMRRLMAETQCRLAVDATHPYAVEASANIREAAAAEGVRYLRQLRRESRQGNFLCVESLSEAARAVGVMPGNVLLTTGAKGLAAFTGLPAFADRFFPRVLPAEESIRECVRLGYRRGHIIAMQGPFSLELNIALMRQFDIAVMVTKDGGTEGGFCEKLLAAEQAGVRAVVIGRPPGEYGLSPDEVFAAIREAVERNA